MNASVSTIPGALLTYWLSVQSHLGFLSPALVPALSMAAGHPTLVLGSRSRWCEGEGLGEGFGGSWFPRGIGKSTQ